jgi:hypothetical protein
MNAIEMWQSPLIVEHSALLIQSYEDICGKKFPISSINGNFSRDLYESDYVLVSHGTEKDPVFNYANLAAQSLWKMNWETFTQMPSRLSAKNDKVTTRAIALQNALAKGYVFDYEGIRVDALGREFYIQHVILWNLMDKSGTFKGQAAMFNRWEYL